MNRETPFDFYLKLRSQGINEEQAVTFVMSMDGYVHRSEMEGIRQEILTELLGRCKKWLFGAVILSTAIISAVITTLQYMHPLK